MKNSLTCLVVFLLSILTTTGSNPQIEANNIKPTFHGAEYKPGKMIVKIKPAYRNECNASEVRVGAFLQAMGKISATTLVKKFPHFKMPSQSEIKSNRKPVDMSLVYEIQFSPVVNIESAINSVIQSGVVLYAEPLYVHQLDYTPNDPQVGSQYHINKINAYNAWDLWKGDTNVVIGIVDSGTDWDHPDLEPSIKKNYADPIDNVDNDNDGFVDNFRGWDVSENDNNPMVAISTHGSHVSGCAAATTDNGIGVAGPAFNCKLLPVKSCLDASANSIDNGYDGIIYAVDHGVDIINCSWGRTGLPSTFEQETIDYATVNNDVLVVAAAGNNGQDQTHYPSSYDGVISVAATTITDGKASFSNYNATVDVSAPGNNILATVFNDVYATESGTSMASPIAAGCAAMIKSRFPTLNAYQVGEQLRTTCDYIYNVSGNSAYNGKLGKGRVNLFKAISDSISPGVIVKSNRATDSDDEIFVKGDTISLFCTFENLLRPTTNLVCSLATNSSAVQILQSTYTAGVLNTFDTISNFMAPYRIYVKQTAPLNSVVSFRVILTDGTWSDTYVLTITVNVDYINVAINNVSTSITSKSIIGYNQTGQLEGLGFTYMNSPTILYDMGLMIGAAGKQVSDNLRGGAGLQNEDFSSVTNVVSQEPGTVSDFDVSGVFDDMGINSPNPLEILIRHNAYAWVASPDDNYVMVQYFIKNTGTAVLNDLYAGLFADWDIPAYANNKCATDVARKMGYVWSTDIGGLYGGIKLLSHTSGFNHYALDNILVSGSINMTDSFDNSEKYQALSTSRTDAGTGTSTGNDVLSVVSSGNFNLAPGDSVEVAFALIGGDNLASIQASADAAQAKYDNIFIGLLPVDKALTSQLYGTYPNPAGKSTRLDFSLNESTNCEIGIYNLLGVKVKTIVNERLTAGKYTLDIDLSKLSSGNYLCRMTAGDYNKTLPITIVH